MIINQLVVPNEKCLGTTRHISTKVINKSGWPKKNRLTIICTQARNFNQDKGKRKQSTDFINELPVSSQTQAEESNKSFNNNKKKNISTTEVNNNKTTFGTFTGLHTEEQNGKSKNGRIKSQKQQQQI